MIDVRKKALAAGVTLAGLVILAAIIVIGNEDRDGSGTSFAAEQNTAAAIGSDIDEQPIDFSRGKFASENATESINEEFVEMRYGFTRWQRERGYGQSGYESFDRATLEALAESGDRSAMHALGMLLSNDEPEEAIKYFEMAAAYGYTTSITEITMINRRLGWRRGPARSSYESAKPQMIDAFAWNLVMQMRNDFKGSLDNELLLQQGQLSPSDVERSCEVAAEIYAALEGRRRENGLTLFDNQPPAQSFFDFSTLGSTCGSWPVARASCEEIQGRDPAKNSVAYACENST